MKIDWGLAFTLVLALFLYSLVDKKLLPMLSSLSTNGGSCVAVVPTNTDSLEDYLAKNYPNAKR